MTDSSFCQQRTIMQLYNKPLPRIELDSINPYLSKKYTKTQLDMRRKAEILKYSSNRSSTQTNSLTKKQQFAMLAKGTYVQPPQQTILRGNIDCSADRMIPTPTSSSGVPGPVMYLYNDPQVPLYNYATFGIRTYPDYVPEETEFWQFISPPDVSLTNSTSAITNYLVIYNTIDKPYYTYSITIPIGIFVAGTSKYTGPPVRLTLSISSATLYAYYNNSVYGAYNSPSFDTSMNLVFDISSSGPFSATYFAGNMTFSGIMLYTSPTFVYSFATLNALTLTANVPNYNSANYFVQSTLKYGTVVNMSNNKNYMTGSVNVYSASGKTNLGGFLTGI